jgi:hypothetical protein
LTPVFSSRGWRRSGNGGGKPAMVTSILRCDQGAMSRAASRRGSARMSISTSGRQVSNPRSQLEVKGTGSRRTHLGPSPRQRQSPTTGPRESPRPPADLAHIWHGWTTCSHAGALTGVETRGAGQRPATCPTHVGKSRAFEVCGRPISGVRCRTSCRSQHTLVPRVPLPLLVNCNQRCNPFGGVSEHRGGTRRHLAAAARTTPTV